MRALWFVWLLAGCQSKQPPEQRASGSGSGPPTTTLDIPLPPASGARPKPTPRPLEPAALERVVAMRFPHFTMEMTPAVDSIAIRQRATTRPRMSVNITLGKCNAMLCRPMDVSAWKADEPALKKLLVDPDLVDRPDSVFEIAERSLGGATLIEVYQAGQYFGTDANGNPVSSYGQAVNMHYNDGGNFLHVTATYADTPRATLQEMKDALPRPFLERVATTFLDVYGQAWSTAQ